MVQPDGRSFLDGSKLQTLVSLIWTNGTTILYKKRL